MKTIVVDDYLADEDVHPEKVYRQLRSVCVEAAQQSLAAGAEDATQCIACGNQDLEAAFSIDGVPYLRCRACESLFVRPRPSQEQLDRYRTTVAAYRKTDEYRSATVQRRAEVARGRDAWLSDLLAVHQKSGLVHNCDSMSAPVMDIPAGAADAITAYAITERILDPRAFAQSAYERLADDGLLVLTTRSASGFDIQVLWENATVFPFEHLNLLSVEGIQEILGAAGFEIVELSTPGQLDVQLVEKHARDHARSLPRLVRYFMKHRDELARHRLQTFLQQNLLSSFMRVVAKKAGS